MKRDFDLIRLILLEIEKFPFPPMTNTELKIEGCDFKTVAKHCELLYNAGLIFYYEESYADNDIYCYSVGGLTWDGYEYLDKIRDNSRWNQVKNFLREKGVPVLLESINTVSQMFISSILNKS